MIRFPYMVVVTLLSILLCAHFSYAQCPPVACDQTNPGTTINSTFAGEVICVTSSPGGNINTNIAHNDVSIYVCVSGVTFNTITPKSGFLFDAGHSSSSVIVNSINYNEGDIEFRSSGGGRLIVLGANMNNGPVNFTSTNESELRLQFSISTANQINLEIDTNSSIRVNSNMTISDGNINVRQGGSFGVNGYFHGNGTDVSIVNYDSMYVDGEFYVQGANAFQNACGEGVLEVGGDFRLNSNSSLLNNGTIRASSTRINSNAGPITMGTGSKYIIAGAIEAQNTDDVFEYSGDAGECAYVEFGSVNNWNFDLSADSEIHYCGPAAGSRPGDATVSCTCNSTPVYCDPFFPVEFAYIRAYELGGVNKVIWATIQEENNSHFIVESSVDGVNFNEIGRVQGSGTTNQFISYEFVDASTYTSSVVYYRIKQVDFDGEYDHSSVASVYTSGTNLAQLVENPISAGSDILLLFSELGGTYNVKVVDAIGRLHTDQFVEVASDKLQTIGLHQGLAIGVYHIIINDGTQSQVIKVLID